MVLSLASSIKSKKSWQNIEILYLEWCIRALQYLIHATAMIYTEILFSVGPRKVFILLITPSQWMLHKGTRYRNSLALVPKTLLATLPPHRYLINAQYFTFVLSRRKALESPVLGWVSAQCELWRVTPPLATSAHVASLGTELWMLVTCELVCYNNQSESFPYHFVRVTGPNSDQLGYQVREVSLPNYYVRPTGPLSYNNRTTTLESKSFLC